MKTTKLLLAIMSAMATAVIAQSCSTTYYQIATIGSTFGNEDDRHLTFSENNITITYDFWAEGGQVSFIVINENEDAVYIDLSKSFFIINGIAYDYYQNRRWTSGKTLSTGVSASYGASFSGRATLYTPFSSTKGIGTISGAEAASESVSSSTSVTIVEKEGEWIPAHSAKTFCEHNLMPAPYRECGFNRFPTDESEYKSFKQDNSPYVYRNELSFIINDTPTTICNEFYLRRLYNVKEERIIKYKAAVDCNGNTLNYEYHKVNTTYSPLRFFMKYIKSSSSANDDTIRRNNKTTSTPTSKNTTTAKPSQGNSNKSNSANKTSTQSSEGIDRKYLDSF